MKVFTFVLVYCVYLNSFAKTIRCLDVVTGVLARPLYFLKKENRLSPLRQDLLNYAENKGLNKQHLEELSHQLKILPDDLTTKEGRELLINPLLYLEDGQEISDFIVRLDEILENHRSIDHVLSSSSIENLSKTSRDILSYAFSYKLTIDVRQKLAQKLTNLPEVLQWEEGRDFIHYLFSLKEEDQFLAIEHMDEIVTGYIKSNIIKEFIRLQGQTLIMESQEFSRYYRKLLLDINKKKLSSREILGLGPQNGELIERAQKLTKEYMDQNRRLIYECRKQASWKTSKNFVKQDFISFSTWTRPAISIPYVLAYNFDRPFIEVALQAVVIEYFFKAFSYKVGAEIFTGSKGSDFVKYIKRYGFSRVYGAITASALYFIFSWTEGKEKEQIFQEIMQDSNKRGELHDMISAMNNDGMYEKFIETIFVNFGRYLNQLGFLESKDIPSLQGIDWNNLTAEDLHREDTRQIIKKAVAEHVYDKNREYAVFDIFPASGQRAVDYWIFNALYAIPFNIIDYAFDTFVYNKFCREAGNLSEAKKKMTKLYFIKRILSDIPYVFSRRSLIGI